MFHRRFRFEIDTNQLYTVARDGHLDAVQWLHANKYPVHCRRAREHNHFHLLVGYKHCLKLVDTVRLTLTFLDQENGKP